MISMGAMKTKYAELFFVRKIVKEGDVIMDIGSNLGYYSYFMAKYQGKKGKLIAVEPIPLFADVWNKNLKKYKGDSVKLFNCALGSEAQDKVNMSIPIVNGVVRHGLTKISESAENGDSIMSFEVPMRVGDEVINENELTGLDYIKCDVEGYEQYVIPSLESTLEKFKPLLQIELGGVENRERVVEYLVKKSYQIFILKGEFLIPIEKNDIFSVNQDFYFIHNDKVEERKDLIRK